MPFRKNVYILGAGASADAGAPLMDTFLRAVRDFRDMKHEDLSSQDLEAFDRVLEYRAWLDKAMSRVMLDPDNIEDLFGMIEMDVGLGLRERSLREAIIRVISRTLTLSTSKGLPGQVYVRVEEQGNYTNHPLNANPYSLFLWLATDALRNRPHPSKSVKDSIISFNYDLVLERNMPGCSLTPEYCLPNELATWKWSETYPARIKLLKLHGSLNWFTCTNCTSGPVQIISPSDDAVQLQKEIRCLNCGSSARPLLIPPTWNKGFAHDVILPVWKAALQEMLQAGRLLIVGYSFPKTDTFFKYLLGLALSLNENLVEVAVVNSSSAAELRYKELFAPYFVGKKVSFFPTKFGECLKDGEFQHISKKVIPKSEYNKPR